MTTLFKWLRSKKALEKKIRREFAKDITKVIEEFLRLEEERILFGDPDSEQKPIGILRAFKEVEKP